MYAHFTISTRPPVVPACQSRALRVLGVPAELHVDNEVLRPERAA